MTMSLNFQFFLNAGGTYEGFELRVDVSPTRDRNAGDNNAVKIRVNGVRMQEAMLNPLGHYSFVVRAPELGLLHGKRIDVELEIPVVGRLNGSVQVEGLPFRLENPMRARGTLLDTDVQRLDWEFIEATTSYVLSYKFKRHSCQLFLNGFLLWEEKYRGGSFRNLLGRQEPIAPPVTRVLEAGLGDACHCAIEVTVGLERGLLHGRAKINMRDLGAKVSARPLDDVVFEPLLQPERALPPWDGTAVQWSRPRKVSHIAARLQAGLQETNPHAALESSQSMRGVAVPTRNPVLVTRSLPGTRIQLDATQSPSGAAPDPYSSRGLHHSASVGSRFPHLGSGGGAGAWAPTGGQTQRDMQAPAGAGQGASTPFRDAPDPGAGTGAAMLRPVPSAPPLQYVSEPVAPATVFAQDARGGVLQHLRTGSGQQSSFSSLDGSEVGGSCSPSSISRTSSSMDKGGYPRTCPQSPSLTQRLSTGSSHDSLGAASGSQYSVSRADRQHDGNPPSSPSGTYSLLRSEMSAGSVPPQGSWGPGSVPLYRASGPPVVQYNGGNIPGVQSHEVYRGPSLGFTPEFFPR
eukprot:jgi/Botrbrau1/7486/Bobra.0095s0022.1